MVDAGADGSQAGTTLRASLPRLVDPPKAAATMLERLGVSTTDSNGKFKTLQQIVAELKKSMEGMTKAEKGGRTCSNLRYGISIRDDGGYFCRACKARRIHESTGEFRRRRDEKPARK
ncbi:phage tail tape measure protein [Bacillus velezensis]